VDDGDLSQDDEDDEDDEDDDDDDDDTQTIRPADSIRSGSSDGQVVVDAPPAINIPRSAPNSDDPTLRREAGKDAEQAVSSFTTAKTVLSPPTPRPSPPDREASNTSTITSLRKKTSTASTTSFETASEGTSPGILVDEPNASSDAGIHRPGPDQAANEPDGTLTPRPRHSENDDPFRDSLLTSSGVGHDSLNSTTPLIHPWSPGIDEEQPRQSGSNVSDQAPTQQHIDIETEEVPTTANIPRPAGLVRFAEPEIQPMKKELQIRARLAQQASKRLPRRFTRGKLRDGEIIKVEKMLVRIDVTSGSEQPGPEYDEKDSQRVETRTTEKWREFMVVCRESHEEDAVLCLQMYKTRVSLKNVQVTYHQLTLSFLGHPCF